MATMNLIAFGVFMKQLFLRLASLLLALTLCIALVSCEKKIPGAPTPSLTVDEGSFKVICRTLYLGFGGSQKIGALRVLGNITNSSEFHIRLKGSYLPLDTKELYTTLVRPGGTTYASELILEPGESIKGDLINIKEQPYTNIPASMAATYTNALLTLDATPVDEEGNRIPISNTAKFIYTVPPPAGFIAVPNEFHPDELPDKFYCPCINYEECKDQEQGQNIIN